MTTEMQLLLVANLLRRGQSLDQLSTALTVFALLVLLASLTGHLPQVPGLLCAGGVLISGLVQKYFAVRVALDADLFAHMASDIQQLPRRTAELDQALYGLGQLDSKAGRNWQQRSQGALALLHRQALFLGLQILILFITLPILAGLFSFTH